VQLADELGLAIPRPKPDLVWNGESFMVVWEGWDTIVGRRVAPDGRILDDEPIRISTEADQGSFPSIAWSGTIHMAVWYDHRDDAPPGIYGARLGLGGRPLDAENVALGAGGPYTGIVVAGSEHGFLVGGGELLDASGTRIGHTDAIVGPALALLALLSFAALRRRPGAASGSARR
jgi:hypothetical protein